MKTYSIKTKILTIAAICMFAFALTLFIIPPAPANASDIKDNLCGGSNFNLDANQCEGSLNAAGECIAKIEGTNQKRAVGAQFCSSEGKVNDLVTNIVNIFSIVVGIVAVIMIIVGGFKFITSGGDSAKVTSSRNTIIYAIVGLIIVALAQTIVKFVLTKVPN